MVETGGKAGFSDQDCFYLNVGRKKPQVAKKKKNAYRRSAIRVRTGIDDLV